MGNFGVRRLCQWLFTVENSAYHNSTPQSIVIASWYITLNLKHSSIIRQRLSIRAPFRTLSLALVVHNCETLEVLTV